MKYSEEFKNPTFYGKELFLLRWALVGFD